MIGKDCPPLGRNDPEDPGAAPRMPAKSLIFMAAASGAWAYAE
jgi:hypothetical protein